MSELCKSSTRAVNTGGSNPPPTTIFNQPRTDDCSCTSVHTRQVQIGAEKTRARSAVELPVKANILCKWSDEPNLRTAVQFLKVVRRLTHRRRSGRGIDPRRETILGTVSVVDSQASQRAQYKSGNRFAKAVKTPKSTPLFLSSWRRRFSGRRRRHKASAVG